MESHQPFPETLKKLLAEKEISQRELARILQRHGDGRSVARINQLARGEDEPSIEVFKLIATALQVPPETFAEYRLAVARRDLDPRSVGLKKALRNLGE